MLSFFLQGQLCNAVLHKITLCHNTALLAEWEKEISESLPKDLQASLPSIEEIEKELSKTDGESLS